MGTGRLQILERLAACEDTESTASTPEVPPAPAAAMTESAALGQAAPAAAKTTSTEVRVQYPCCNAMQVPIEIYRLVTRVAKAWPFSGRDFFVEKGTLAEQERTHPGEVFPGLPFMIPAIPAKAVLGVTGSSTATRSDASCVGPRDSDWTPWRTTSSTM
jgi:hypothetical protein